MDIARNPVFLLFIIISLGILIGRIKIKSFSFGTPAILLVALLFGNLGLSLPVEFKEMGLVLFIYSIGLRAAPTFFTSLNKRVISAILIGLTIVTAAAVSSVVIGKIFGFKDPLILGIFDGALTSTPGLAVAIEASRSETASLGYAVAYPIGMIITILFLQFYCRISKIDVPAEEEKYRIRLNIVKTSLNQAVIKALNPGSFGKKLDELKISHKDDEVTVSRVKRDNHVFSPDANYRVEKGDLLRLVGKESAIELAAMVIGPKTKEHIPWDHNLRVLRLMITNKEVVGRSLGSLALRERYGVNVTRIRRTGVELAPRSDLLLNLGDKVVMVCPLGKKDEMIALFGNEMDVFWSNTLLPISVGIVFGLLLGQIKLELPGLFSLKLGLAGGPLISALILGRLMKTGPITWSIPYRANRLIREIGLALFLAVVGTSAGKSIAGVLHNGGVKLLIGGGLVAFTSLLITATIFSLVSKIDKLSLLGALAGGMTSSTGLAATNSIVNSEIPLAVFTQVFPFAVIAMVLMNQLLVYIL